MRPCPCCDARALSLVQALAFGVTLGACVGGRGADGLREVTEMMCPDHRMAYVLAMAHVAAAVAS